MAPWRLPRRVGVARAKALLLGGADLTANQAAQWGVVDQVVPTGGLEEAWEELVAPSHRVVTDPPTFATAGR